MDPKDCTLQSFQTWHEHIDMNKHIASLIKHEVDLVAIWHHFFYSIVRRQQEELPPYSEQP